MVRKSFRQQKRGEQVRIGIGKSVENTLSTSRLTAVHKAIGRETREENRENHTIDLLARCPPSL